MVNWLRPSMALACVLSVAAVAGCNSYPGGGLPATRSTVVLNSLQIPADTPLAVQLDVRPLLATHRSVQAIAPSPTPSVGPVTEIEVVVSGGNLTSPVVKRVSIADCAASGVASFLFYLPAGSYKVIVNALDADGQRVSYGIAEDVQVADNNQTVVPVSCIPVSGSILIEWTPCGPNCTPSATPTPVPSPHDPIAENLVQSVTGFNVDQQGNIYLFGADYGIPLTQSYSEGRIIKVLPDLTFQSRIIDEDMGLVSEGTITDDNVLVTRFLNRVHRISLNTIPEAVVSTTTNESSTRWATHLYAGPGDTAGYPVYARIPYAASAVNPRTGQTVFTSTVTNSLTECPIYLESTSNPNSPKLEYPGYADPERVSCPLAMEMDASTETPIWTNKEGIYTLPDAPFDVHAKPKTLLDLRTSTETASGAYGLAALDANARKILFTKPNDPSIYYWDRDNPGIAPSVAITATRGQPFRIEKGKDGNIYVMLHEGIVSGGLGTTTSKLTAFRVVKLDYNSVAHTLAFNQIMVDSFTTQSPGY